MTEELKNKELKGNENKQNEFDKDGNDMVSVDKKTLDQILKRQSDMEVEVGILREVADKARLAAWDEKHKKEKAPIVKLSFYKGKVIIGWKTVIDEVWKDNNGIWREKQVIEIYFEDKTTEQLNYIDFVRLITKIDSVVKGREKDEENGTETLKVAAKDGKEYKIDIRFVN